MLDVNSGTFLSLTYRHIHFQDDFNINSDPNFNSKFSNFSNSKTLGNVIIFRPGRIAVENLTCSGNGYEYISLNVLFKRNPPYLNVFLNNAGAT